MPITLSACKPVPSSATPVAVTPPAGAGEKVTVGATVYPEAASTILTLIAIVDVAVARLIPG